MKHIYSKIIGTGSYIAPRIIKNEDFINNDFFEDYGKRSQKSGEEIIKKFYEITGIKERRYVEKGKVNSEISTIAAKNAIENADIDPETIDLIIVAHNYGDAKDDRHSDMVPALAARVKHYLGIKNPNCIPYDVIFGCPGWILAMTIADNYIKSSNIKRALVIGAEILSYFTDPYDRDGMIFADGAGATILEATEAEHPVGIISHKTRNDADKEAFYIYNNHSLNPDYKGEHNFFTKMHGHKVYEYALKTVPQVVKETIDKAGIPLEKIKKILIHQANEKMDAAIIKRLFRLYGYKDFPKDIMPMTISWLGNSSVATIPTMLDLILRGKMEGHTLKEGDYAVFTSIGAGMNINAIVYKF